MTSERARDPAKLTPHGKAQHEALIRAAFDLIEERGFELLRTRDVAARAGVNIATLHYYFPSKEDLIRGVARFVHQEFSVTFRTQPVAGERSALDALRADLRDDAVTFREHPGIYVVLSEFYLRARRDPAIAANAARLDADWQAHLARIIAPGIQQRVFRADLDPEFVALVLTSFLKGALICALAMGETYPLERVVAQLETLLTEQPAATVSFEEP